MERSFLSRFEAGVDFGYSMTRANSLKQLTLGGNLAYRDQHNLDTMLVDIFGGWQETLPETKRWDLVTTSGIF